MIKSIVDGIGVALYSNFNGVDVLSEGIEQGFTAPCFYIDVVRSSESPLLGNRSSRQVVIDVHYFPLSETEPNAELELVASRLYPILRQLELLDGTMIRGLNLHHEIIDDVLHFGVEFKTIVYYQSGEPLDLQEQISHKVGVKQ